MMRFEFGLDQHGPRRALLSAATIAGVSGARFRSARSLSDLPPRPPAHGIGCIHTARAVRVWLRPGSSAGSPVITQRRPHATQTRRHRAAHHRRDRRPFTCGALRRSFCRWRHYESRRSAQVTLAGSRNGLEASSLARHPSHTIQMPVQWRRARGAFTGALGAP
jgi:hypothetical protein